MQGQTTNDVKTLKGGESQSSALIGVDGRLVCFFQIVNREEFYLIFISEELKDMFVERLEKYIVMDDVAISMEGKHDFYLVLGPESAFLKKELQEETYFETGMFSDIGIILWGENNIRKLHQSGIKSISPQILEEFRILSGWPLWNCEVGSKSRINETTLNQEAVSYDKGCFIGQEVVAKIETRRKDAYSPVLLKIQNGNIDNIDRLKGLEFNVQGRKGGKIHSIARMDDQGILSANLFREFRVEGKLLNIQLDGLDEIAVEVSTFPFIRKCIDQRQKARDLFHRASDLFAKQGLDDEAIKLLDKALRLDPKCADAYEAWGVIEAGKGNYQQAITLMDKLLEADPDSVMAHTNKSLYYMKLGNIPAAEEEKACATAKSFRLASRQAKDKKVEEQKGVEEREELSRQEDLYQQVLVLDPKDSFANFGMGDIAVKRKEYEKAITYFDTVLASDPHYSVAYLGLGKAFLELGNVQKAIDIFQRGIDVAAKKGELKPANEMQYLLNGLQT